MSPVSVNVSTRESNSDASNVSSLRSKSTHAEEVHLQVEDRDVFGRQRHAQHAEDGEGRPRDLEDEAELEADERRRAPAELAHRADQEAAR